MVLEVLLLTVVVVTTWWFFNDQFVTGKQLPPGPFRLPIIGTWVTFAGAFLKNPEIPYNTFKKLCQRYGPIISIKAGSIWQIVVDDPQIIKEVLSREDFSDRGHNANGFVQERSWGRPMGILFGMGDDWKELRRFSIRTLRDFGFGKQTSQDLLMEEELRELMGAMNESLAVGEDVVPMNQFFTVSILNIIWSMVAGMRFGHKDPKLHSLVTTTSELMTTISAGGNLLMAFPALRHIPGVGTLRKRNLAKLHKKFEEILFERRQVGEYQQDQRDFIDVFLKEIDRCTQNGDHSAYNDKQFIVVLFDLFIAGSETTANTLEFAILYMILNPEVQRKVQAEIDSVVGPNRFPVITDRPKLAYTEATIHEIQRLANVVPMISRAAVYQTTIRSYTILKDHLVVLNSHSVHMNPKLWKEPYLFSPDRFLDGNKIINTDNLLVFGAGRRVCIGELMARTTLFTFFTTMLQNYTFEASPLHVPPSTTPRFGLTQSTQPYFARVSARSQR